MLCCVVLCVVSCRVVSCRVVSCRVVSCCVVLCCVLCCVVLCCFALFACLVAYFICFIASMFYFLSSRFNSVRVQSGSVVHMHSSPVSHRGMNFTATSLTVEGGGKIIGSDLHIEVVNLTIDAGGELSLTGEGYKLADGTGSGVNGVINYGRGVGSGSGASGGGHGGTGGRGSRNPYVGFPYGNLYEPDAFGSSGGGALGKEGTCI